MRRESGRVQAHGVDVVAESVGFQARGRADNAETTTIFTDEPTEQPDALNVV